LLFPRRERGEKTQAGKKENRMKIEPLLQLWKKGKKTHPSIPYTVVGEGGRSESPRRGGRERRLPPFIKRRWGE